MSVNFEGQKISFCPDCSSDLNPTGSRYIFICTHCKKVWEWTEKKYKYGILDFIGEVIKNGLFTYQK